MTNNTPTNTNTLPTFADLKQTKTNWLPTTRRSQMVYLATLTAITLIGQYVLLGVTGLGETRATLPDWFTPFELTLWGMRGLVEIAVVVYIGMTKPKTNNEAVILWLFEAVLILMIVFTVGPIWGAFALSESLVNIWGRWGVIVWGFGLAGISAVMLAGVAYAFKVQPNDEDSVVVTLVRYKKMLAIVDEATQEKEKALVAVGEATNERDKAFVERDNALAELEGIQQAFAFFRLLSSSSLVKLAAMFADGKPDAYTLAEEFGLSPSTVRGILAKVVK